MEHASDVTLLRRELIRMAREAERKDAEAARRFAEYEGVIEGLRAENLDMKRRLAYYENPHSPPSGRSLPSVKRQAARKIKDGGAAPVKEVRRPAGSRATGA